MKTIVDHASSVVLIFPTDDPTQFLIEQKDKTHPQKSVRWRVCFFGGNWRGPEAVEDASPYDTLARELREELAGIDVNEHPREASALLEVLEEILRSIKPFGTSLWFPREDGDDIHEEPALVSVFQCGLDCETWNALASLQKQFGDLSAEYSSSRIASLKDMASGRFQPAWGFGIPFRQILLSKGFNEAKQIPHNKGYRVEYIGPVPNSYKEAGECFSFLKVPPA